MFRVQVKSGKIVDELPLENNFYLMQIFPEKCKTLKEYQAQAFVNVDEYCNSTGNQRYEIWQQFKEENNIESSTKIPLEQFPEVIEMLRFWLMQKL